MDVAREVALVLQSSDAASPVALLCQPDGADTVCAYGILKILFFHCCRDTVAYTDCTSPEIVRHHLEAAQIQGIRIVVLINCYWEIRRELAEILRNDVSCVVLDRRAGRQKRIKTGEDRIYILGGSEEAVLKRLHERNLRMQLPNHAYHGTPAALCAYHICLSMSPRFRHINALWRAMVGVADVFQRKLIHQDQYTHIHNSLMQDIESAPYTASIEECHETCIHFFQQSNLWDALHMSPHLYEKFDDAAGFQDFIANDLGFPQNIAEYQYYQFVTGPGSEIWEKLQSAGNQIGVQDLVLPGFQRTINGTVIHSMDHALAVNVALWHLRSQQYQQETLNIHAIFEGGEEAMGKPLEKIPHYVALLKSDCDAKRKKCRPL